MKKARTRENENKDEQVEKAVEWMTWEKLRKREKL